MKVELNEITLGYSQMTKKVYLGVTEKDGLSWKCKKDVTDEFHLMISCVQPEKRYTQEDVDRFKEEAYKAGNENAFKDGILIGEPFRK